MHVVPKLNVPKYKFSDTAFSFPHAGVDGARWRAVGAGDVLRPGVRDMAPRRGGRTMRACGGREAGLERRAGVNDWTIILRSMRVRAVDSADGRVGGGVGGADARADVDAYAGEQAFSRGSRNVHLWWCRALQPLMTVLNQLFYKGDPAAGDQVGGV